MKRFFTIITIFVMCINLSACSSGITIPDVANVELADGKNAITTLNLIPSIEYDYSDTIDEGRIISTSPEIGSSVPKNSKIILYVSKGPEYIEAKNSTINWYLIGDDDNWDFYVPFIDQKDSMIYIMCEPTFSVDLVWKGDGFGIASSDDSFSASVPISIELTENEVKAGEVNPIGLKIPLRGFDTKYPTSIYTKLYALVDGAEKEISVNFNIEW